MKRDDLTLLNNNDIIELLETKEWVEVTLTDLEKKPLIGIVNIKCFYRISTKERLRTNVLPSIIKLEVKTEVSILDDYTNKAELETYSGSEELLLTSEIEDDDLVERKNGLIDLRPSFLAVLYSLIPLTYSKNKVDRYVVDDVVIMSEEEYERTKTINPFSGINSGDFDDW